MATPTEEHPNPFGHIRSISDMTGFASSSAGATMSADSTTGLAAGERPPKGKKRVGFSRASEKSEKHTHGASQVEGWDGARSPRSLSPRAPISENEAASPGPSGSNTPLTGPDMRQGRWDRLQWIPQPTSSTGTGADTGTSDAAAEANRSHLPELSPLQTEQLRGAISLGMDEPTRPRPALRRGGSSSALGSVPESADERSQGARSAREAFERGKALERSQLSFSAPASRHSSPPPRIRTASIPAADQGIPLQDLGGGGGGGAADTRRPSQQDPSGGARGRVRSVVEAADSCELPRSPDSFAGATFGFPEPLSATSPYEQTFAYDYQPAPTRYRSGILGSLLKLRQYHDSAAYGSSSDPATLPTHARQHSYDRSAASSQAESPPGSGASTPRVGRFGQHQHTRGRSTASLATLIGTPRSPSACGAGKDSAAGGGRPGMGARTRSGSRIVMAGARQLLGAKQRAHEQYRITRHIAESIARQKYLLKLCRALMEYGAPTHRLEEYMAMSARVLDIDAQFLYIPGAMLVSFEDRATHTSEVRLIRAAQGLDLGRLRDVHEIYKEVIRDQLGVDDALVRLKELTGRAPKHSRLVRLPVYGLAAVCVGPYAFGAQLVDLPVAFCLGLVLGVLQLYVAPASDLYANVFEIAAAVITSFLARALGSIRAGSGAPLFCFSALAQSSIALILPGYTVLCASLELQSRSLVAGSVRMVYAIIYSLFLGFGITIGTAVYGIIDRSASSEVSCARPIPEYWYFFFVPGFTLCLVVINQAKWKQAPVMMLIAFAGYVVNYFSARRFEGNTQVSNTLGALAIGVLANLYSRIGGRLENHALDLWEHRLLPWWERLRSRVLSRSPSSSSSSSFPSPPSFSFSFSFSLSAKQMEEGIRTDSTATATTTATTDSGSPSPPPPPPPPSGARRVGYGLAAAAMLPAIFVQVPSGLAVNGSLVSGIASANQITGNSTNGTQVVVNATSLSASAAMAGLNSIAFNVGYSVIQVAIGITVGLFLSAIVVYPFGKKRSGLFSF